MKVSRPLSLVKPGDPVSASAQNRLIQQVQENAAALGTGSTSPSQSRIVLRCKNISGEDFEVGEAVAWKDLLSVTAAGDFNPREAIEDAIYQSERITWHDNLASLGIVLDDTPDQDIGRIVIGGQAVIRLSSPTAGEYAFPDPATPKHWLLSKNSGYRVVDQINDDWAIVNVSMNQNRWIYKLTESSQAPATTTAKLLNFDLTEFSSTTIELSDPLSIGDGDATDYQGYCDHVGNEFHIAPGPC